jgi:hypothetical protein
MENLIRSGENILYFIHWPKVQKKIVFENVGKHIHTYVYLRRDMHLPRGRLFNQFQVQSLKSAELNLVDIIKSSLSKFRPWRV